MKPGHLSEYFSGVAAKVLTAVEVNPLVSNQREFNGVSRLKLLLGAAKRTLPTRFVYLCDTEDAPTTAEGELTWYDARANHITRSEYRLYFSSTPVSERFEPGDLFILGLRPDQSAMCVVAKGQSTAANQLLWLFGLERDGLEGFAVADEAAIDKVQLQYASGQVLDAMGVEQSSPHNADNMLSLIEQRFGTLTQFPGTREFSEFARTCSGLDARDDPDDVLLAWMQQEELAFRTLERHLIADRLQSGFGGSQPGTVDVDQFISFSLSVQNRRKSRAGHALENHLQAVWEAHGIHHTRTAVTENKSRPDFIFPGSAQYHDPHFSAAHLTLLAAKTSAKDRWRQILGEADRIDVKHLLTLEPGISDNQTREMQARKVVLVLPAALHASYSEAQRLQLMDVRGFMDVVLARQGQKHPPAPST